MALRILPSQPHGYVSPVATRAQVGSQYPSLAQHGAACWLGIFFILLRSVTGDFLACNERKPTNMKKKASVHMHLFMRGCIC